MNSDRNIDEGFDFVYNLAPPIVDCTFNGYSPSPLEAGDTFTVNLTLTARVNGPVTYSGSTGSPGVTFGSPLLSGSSWNATTSSPGNQKAVTATGTVAGPGQFDIDITVNFSGAATGTAHCTFPVISYNKPYVRTFEGDSFAGTTCGAGDGWPASHKTGSDIDAGGIYGIGSDAAPAAGRGSASQLALLSLFQIRNFRSRAILGSPYDGLFFANSNLPAFSVPSGPKGGYLGLDHCPTDYVKFMPVPATAFNAASKGVYKANSAQTFAGLSNYASQAVYYVDGDVTITGNVTYDLAGWTDRSHIPSFTLVATGNIYIAPGVTQLDGTYVAQATDGVTPKTIYTCANTGVSPVRGYQANDATYYASCNNQLTVNGALIAARVKFLRTLGSLRNSKGSGDHPDLGSGAGTSNSCDNAGTKSSPGTCAAEVINFRPEAFLAIPPALESNPTQANFDSVISPPPLL